MEQGDAESGMGYAAVTNLVNLNVKRLTTHDDLSTTGLLKLVGQ